MTMVIYTENRYVLNFKFYVGNTRPLPKESNPKKSLQSNAYMTMVIYTENRYVLSFKFYVGNTRPLPKESNPKKSL